MLQSRWILRKSPALKHDIIALNVCHLLVCLQALPYRLSHTPIHHIHIPKLIADPTTFPNYFLTRLEPSELTLNYSDISKPENVFANSAISDEINQYESIESQLWCIGVTNQIETITVWVLKSILCVLICLYYICEVNSATLLAL